MLMTLFGTKMIRKVTIRRVINMIGRYPDRVVRDSVSVSSRIRSEAKIAARSQANSATRGRAMSMKLSTVTRSTTIMKIAKITTPESIMKRKRRFWKSSERRKGIQRMKRRETTKLRITARNMITRTIREKPTTRMPLHSLTISLFLEKELYLSTQFCQAEGI